MKKTKIILLIMLAINGIIISSCNNRNDDEDTLFLNTEFNETKNLVDGNNAKTKVILLFGQSNATGVSLVSYLKENVSKQKYQMYENGFDNVLINYYVDNGTNSSNGEFIKTSLNFGHKNGYFGPEVGMADILSQAFLEEKIVILKYTYSGSSLTTQWLYNQKRHSIYNAAIKFVKYYLDILESENYDVSVDAICFMQGESDTSNEAANEYYQSLKSFVGYLRDDLKEYQNENGIYFIDAGISDSVLWSPGYSKVNEAKRKFSELSHLNIYFSNIDLGLVENFEPVDNPDLAHYDSLSEIKLGEEFEKRILEIYQK